MRGCHLSSPRRPGLWRPSALIPAQHCSAAHISSACSGSGVVCRTTRGSGTGSQAGRHGAQPGSVHCEKKSRKLTIKYWNISFQFIVVNLRHFSQFFEKLYESLDVEKYEYHTKMLRFSGRKFTTTRKVTTKALENF